MKILKAKSLRFSFFVPVFICFVSFPVFTQNSPGNSYPGQVSKAVSEAVSAIFENKTREAVTSSFNSRLSSLRNLEDKRQLLFLFADYEERSGFFESAAGYYVKAAGISPENFNLYLDGARCYMYINDREKASDLVQKTLLGCFEPDVLCRARFYSACIQLAEGDTEGAFSLLRTYTSNSAFKPFYPQMLFILWYAADDSNAKNRLLSEYSDSMEASLVRGEAALSPQAFWYFMPAGERRMASRIQESSAAGSSYAGISSTGDSNIGSGSSPSRETGGKGQSVTTSASSTSDPVAKGLWQQTGLFKSRVNAEAMAEELSKAGFRVFIRQEKRESGTTYFSVLIPEDESGSTAMQLKDKGFESYLVID